MPAAKKPRGRPRKYHGPKMRSGAFKSKAKKKGLNSTEKKQVKDIVLNTAETKYFNVTSRYDLKELKGNPIQTGANMYCLGFSAGWNITGTPNNTSNITYGIDATTQQPVSVKELNLSKIHSAGDFTLEGEKLKVSFQNSKWFIERTQIDTDSATQQIKDALPTMCRMIRIRPKALKSSYTVVDPQNDLFLDQQNQAYGIRTAGFQKMDLVMAKANNRRYTIVEDKTFTLLPPFTQNDLDIGAGTNQVRNISKDNVKHLHMSHKLGKNYYYDTQSNPNGYITPQTGFVNEYIFFHFQHLGDDSTFAARASADDWRISCIPTGGFKDI